MAILKIDYSELSSSSRNAKKASEDIGEYSDKLSSGVARRISGISGSRSSALSNALSNALSKTQEKIRELNDKSEKLNVYSEKIEEFKENVIATDERVSKEIRSDLMDFVKDNGIKISKVELFFESLVVGLVNESSLARWAKTLNDKKQQFEDNLAISIKYWYETGGGKFVKDIALSIVAIGVAIGGVLAIGAASTLLAVILGVVSIVGAAIAIVNSITNIAHSVNAIKVINTDPGKASMYGKLDSLSDHLRKEGEYGWAFAWDTAELVTSLVDFGKSITEVGVKGINKLKDMNFRSIKQLFGDESTNTIGKLKLPFVDINIGNKATLKSISDGLKTVFTNDRYHNLVKNSLRLFKDELKTFVSSKKIEMNINMYNFKNFFTGTTSQKNHSIYVFKEFIKKDIIGSFKHKVNTDILDVNKIDTPNILGWSPNLNSTFGSGFKYTIKALKVIDIGKAYIGKKYVTDKIFEDLSKIKSEIEGIKDKSTKISDSIKQSLKYQTYNFQF